MSTIQFRNVLNVMLLHGDFQNLNTDHILKECKNVELSSTFIRNPAKYGKNSVRKALNVQANIQHLIALESTDKNASSCHLTAGISRLDSFTILVE